MARANISRVTFNRGRISKLGMGRTDLERTRMSAEIQTNWVPRTLGSMMVRPGLGFIGGIRNNEFSRAISFVRASTDTALIEVTDGFMRVWVSDALITRAGSTASITGGTFDSTGLVGWTDADDSGSTSLWVEGGYLGLVGTRYARARRRQTVTASSGEHGLAVAVERGRPILKVGSSAGGDDYLEETQLRPGKYSFGITTEAVAQPQEMIDRTLGTAIGDMTSGGGLAAAFDGTTNQASSAGAVKAAGTDSFVGKNWGTGNAKTLTGFTAYGSNNSGFIEGADPSVTITLQGSADNFVSDVNDLGDITFTDTTDESAGRSKLTGITATTAYQYHRIKIASGGLGTNQLCAECQFFETPDPDGTFHVEFSANTEYASLVDSIAVESSGPMTLATPWASNDLGKLRWDQSADVIYVGAYGYLQKRIERHAAESWAVVDYDPEDGPFRNINVTNKRLTPSGLTGNITLACDQPLFKAGHDGALFRITSIGQKVTGSFTGGDQFTDPIRVTGVGDTRKFTILVSTASAAGRVVVQRSVGEVGQWADVTALTFTSSIDSTHDDGLDNQVVFYRIGTETTSTGSATVELNYASGGLTGVAKITSVAAATESSAIVLKAFGSTAPSELWYEGDWSTLRGFPSAVRLYEGRLAWAGKSKLWASVSDGFESFDDETEGDSGPINRSIASGPVDTIEWLVGLSRLVLGAQGAEVQAKTSSLEEPLTPSNFALRDISTQGSASVQAVKIDQRLLFVQAGGTRVFEVVSSESGLDVQTVDRTIVVPEIGEPGIVRMAVQRQPDTRIHCVRSDGTVAILVNDPAENVLAWIDVTTDGEVEDVAVLPGTIEDTVYYVVKRTINGETARYLEKWAKESEAHGGPTNKMADSFIVQNSTATTSISVPHLAGESVVIWGSTTSLGTGTVSTDGVLTASVESTTFVVGKFYEAWFKSAKLAEAASAGTSLTQRKKIDSLGLILADTHARGLKYGPSTESSRLDFMPLIEGGERISTDSMWTDYDKDSFPFPGTWDTDSRMVLYGQAPLPATVLASVMTMTVKDKI